MSEKTILVIDDSATIRRLVDSELGNAGYRVVMAATAEEGLDMARNESPDLILLDHQLPGTTGYDVCCQLIQDDSLKNIPVVCSSTLRKKAYAEYTELPNVIDMLPKPYTPELLRTIIANALETASMVVNSQSGGTAVPEVIDEMAEGDLSGSFACFSMREVIDFLNNASRQGVLEMDLGRARVSVHLSNGRIQALTASGIEAGVISGNMPAAISDLAPMVKFTIRGRNSSEIDGLVDLLDNKVLDERLLRQLLRHQAAALVQYCQANPPRTFRFQRQAELPKLFTKLPLDTSLMNLMVVAALTDQQAEPSAEQLQDVTWVRASQRGQNLDRGGLAARHMKLLNHVANPVTASELASLSGLSAGEVWRVMQGFMHADLVTCQKKRDVNTVITVTGNASHARKLADFFRVETDSVCGKVVRDALAVKLLSRRFRPDMLVFDMDCEQTVQALQQLSQQCPAELADVRWVVLTNQPREDMADAWSQVTDVCRWPESVDQMRAIFGCPEPSSAAGEETSPALVN